MFKSYFKKIVKSWNILACALSIPIGIAIYLGTRHGHNKGLIELVKLSLTVLFVEIGIVVAGVIPYYFLRAFLSRNKDLEQKEICIATLVFLLGIVIFTQNIFVLGAFLIFSLMAVLTWK